LSELKEIDGGEGHVDLAADIGVVAQGVECGKIATRWNDEALAGELTVNAFGIALVFQFQLGSAVGVNIGEIFKKEEDEDVILVFTRLDGASKSVTGTPDEAVNFGLVDMGMVRHGAGGLAGI
jgi:hypothetical protein